MHKVVNIIVAFSLSLTAAYAANHTTSLDSNLIQGWNSINVKMLENDISYLASDELQGRLILTEGDDKAIEWIKNEFQKMGLKPVGKTGYLQPVPLIEYVHDDKKTFLTLADTHESWKTPDITSTHPKTITLTRELIFAGFGITAPDLQYDDYQNIDVSGKIVLIFEHEPQEQNAMSIFNGKANTVHGTTRIKALNAQRHGAIGVLIVPEPNRTHPSTAEVTERIGGQTTHIPLYKLLNDELTIPVFSISNKVANALVGSDVLLSELQENIDKNLKPQSRAFPNKKITLHNEVRSINTGTTYNVVGLLEGQDRILKDETIIVSAHHDHNGSDKNAIWHGADDNASGIAGVVEIARAFTTNIDAKVKRSILFVVFAGEERGLLGSIYMVNHPLRPLATTRAMINFDMIGRNEAPSKQTDGLIDIPSNTTNRLNLISNHYSPDYENILKKVNASVELELDDRFNDNVALNVFYRSDHFLFVDKGIPAFWWFTGFHPDYHQVSDTAEKINYQKMEKILRLAYLSTLQFANDLETPRFVKNPMPSIS